MVSHAVKRRRDKRTVLHFVFLVYPQEGPAGQVWFARSVLSGHVVHAPSAAGAAASLCGLLDAALYTAERYGQSPREWYDAQRPDEQRFVLEFCRLVSRGGKGTRKKLVSRAGCVLEARIFEPLTEHDLS